MEDNDIVRFFSRHMVPCTAPHFLDTKMAVITEQPQLLLLRRRRTALQTTGSRIPCVLKSIQGDIRYKHIGEGRYDEIEAAIQTLLAEPYP